MEVLDLRRQAADLRRRARRAARGGWPAPRRPAGRTRRGGGRASRLDRPRPPSRIVRAPSRSASSPKNPPAPTVVRIAGSLPSSGVTMILTEPLATMNRESPGSPPWKITSPRRNRRDAHGADDEIHAATRRARRTAGRRRSASRTSGSWAEPGPWPPSYARPLRRAGGPANGMPRRTARLSGDGSDDLLDLRRRDPGPLPAVRIVRDASRGRARGQRDPALRDRRQLRPQGLDRARRAARSRVAARGPDPLLRRDAGRSSSRTAARSRRSSATRSWRSSGSRCATTTTPSARSRRQPRASARSPPSTTGSRQNWGVRLVVRTGIATGEVIFGEASIGQHVLTGDTMTISSAMEQNAPPLEVLIAGSTYDLVRDMVEVEPVDPVTPKGATRRTAGVPTRLGRGAAAGRSCREPTRRPPACVSARPAARKPSVVPGVRDVRRRLASTAARPREPQDRHARLRGPEADAARRRDTEPRGSPRRHDPLLRGDAGPARARTAGQSRSSSATRSWRSSACRSATRTTRSGRSGRPPRCRPPCPP